MSRTRLVSVELDTDYNNCTPQRERELFPSNNDDSDELGHISPHNDSSPPNLPINSSPYAENRSSEHSLANFSKSTIADHIILENIRDNDKRDVVKSVASEEENWFENKISPSNEDYYERSDDNMSPLYLSPEQITPPSTTVINSEASKLTNKSLLESGCSSSEPGKPKIPFYELPATSKHSKLDHGSVVQTVLFPKSEAVSEIPTTLFYSKSSTPYRGHAFKNINVETRKVKQKVSPYLCGRRGSRKQFGEINAGVKHKIKKPRKHKIKKPRNRFAEELHRSRIQMDKDLEDIRRIFSTPNISEIQLHENSTLFSQPSTSASATQNIQNQIGSDENEITTDDILFNLDDGNNKESDRNSVHIINMNKEVSKCAPQLVVKAHNSVAMSENAVHLHTSAESQQCKNNNLSLNCSLVSKHVNKECVLLSPTSQMRNMNMTWGLAPNSPKKAKQNINSILNNENFSNLDSFTNIASSSDMEQEKVFPIFYGMNKVSLKNIETPKADQVSKKPQPIPKIQMLLDAGQQKCGNIQCSDCKFVYHMGDPDDELIHLNYHGTCNTLRFNGWKDEHVMAEFSNARIIRVLPSDPKPCLEKVKNLLEVISRDLGYYEMQSNLDHAQVYLYIKQKTFAGCLVAESRSTACRMLTDDVGIDLCSERSYPVKCGVSLIWVSQSCRKEGIGTLLLNFLRANFVYDTILNKDDIAFSSPTQDGKAFAIKYFNTPNFLIYT